MYYFLFSGFVFALPKPSLQDEKHILSLIENLKSSELLIQVESMRQLEDLGNKTIPYLLEYMKLNRKSWRVLHLLAKHQRPEIISTLKENIQSEIKKKDHGELLHLYLYSLAHFSSLDEILFVLEYFPYNNEELFGEPILYKLAKTHTKNFLKALYIKQKFDKSDILLNKVFKRLHLSPQTIIRLLNSKDPAHQAGALFILRCVRAQGVEPFFGKGLESQDTTVLIQAIMGSQEYYLIHLFPKLAALIPLHMNNFALKLSLESALKSLNSQKNFLFLFKKVQFNSPNIYLKYLVDLDHRVLTQNQKKQYLSQIIPYLETLLNDKNVDMQKWAIEKINNLYPRHPSLITSLEKLRNDKNVDIQKWAIEKLIHFYPQYPALVTSLEKLLNEPISDVQDQRWIIDRFYELSPNPISKKSIKKLTAFLKNNHLQLATKNMLIEYLISLPFSETQKLVQPYLEKPEFESSVFNGLIKLKSSKSIPFLMSKLLDKKIVNKCNLFEVLDELAPLQTKEMIFSQENLVLSFLSGPDEQCRYQALKRLIRLDPPYIETVLISFLSYRISDIQILAIRELKKRKSKKSVSFLIQQLASQNPMVQEEIVKALTEIGDPQAISPLMLTGMTTQHLGLKKEIRLALQRFNVQKSTIK